MRAILLVVTAAAALAGGVVFAQSGADVLKSKGCMNCHENDKKKVGPAYKDVAA
jgi:cytochrome c